jgi:hypothetical protein
MIKGKTLCVIALLLFSCADNLLYSPQQRPLLSQVQRCLSDGANIYIQCDDERESIIELGFGEFALIEDGKIEIGRRFCGKDPKEVSINILNAHIKYEEIKIANGFKVAFQKKSYSRCLEIKKIANLTRISSMNIELFQLSYS